jgi:hypothetical protein
MLDHEKDLHLTAEDFAVMGAPPSSDPRDLSFCLDFLETIGAFESKKAEAKPYTEEFRL